jgi:FkbM family methyltransferase
MIRRLSAHHPVFLDIGANFGIWTTALAAAHPNAHVYSLEPTPDTFSVLCSNICLNGLKNITALQLAASDSNGSLSYQVTEKAPQLNRLSPRGPEAEDLHRDQYIGARTIEVRSVRLDDFCRERQIDRIGFLKIDTEGAEVCVMRGAENLLRRRAIELMWIEVEPENLREMGDSLQVLAGFVRDMGYSVHFLQPDGEFSPAVDMCSGHAPKMIVKPKCPVETTAGSCLSLAGLTLSQIVDLLEIKLISLDSVTMFCQV